MPTVARAPRAADSTRERILRTAFREFLRHGFQSGSLNRIVEAAGVTKGALFHHFADKRALGYAVVDEIVEPLLMERWVTRLERAGDPLSAMQEAFRTYVEADIASGSWLHGCPLNNLAQEMSPLDDGFRARIDALYDRWRSALGTALARGKTAGTVRASASPPAAAALLVASQRGIWGTGKSSQSQTVMRHATDGVCAFLDSLRP